MPLGGMWDTSPTVVIIESKCAGTTPVTVPVGNIPPGFFVRMCPEGVNEGLGGRSPAVFGV